MAVIQIVFYSFLILINSLGISHNTPGSHSFPSLSMSVPHLCDPLYTKEKRKINKNKIKSNLWFLYMHWSMIKLSVAFPLNRTESFPSCTHTRSHQLWRANISILITLFKSSFLLLGGRIELGPGALVNSQQKMICWTHYILVHPSHCKHFHWICWQIKRKPTHGPAPDMHIPKWKHVYHKKPR